MVLFLMDCFLPLKKCCLTIDENGITDDHKTFKGSTDSQRLIDRSKKIEMLKGNKKDLAPNLNELRRQPQSAFGHMLPWCIDDLNEYPQRLSNS